MKGGKSSLQNAASSVDVFDLVSVTSPTSIKPKAAGKDGSSLLILQHVHSIRDQAREEFGKVYKVLAPYYNDAIFIRATYELHGVQILLFARATSADADAAQIFCPDWPFSRRLFQIRASRGSYFHLRYGGVTIIW
jgi:hypothetical protein